MKRLGEEFLKSFSIRFEGDPLWQGVRRSDDESAETENERLSLLLDKFMKVQKEAGVPEGEQINLTVIGQQFLLLMMIHQLLLQLSVF